MTTEQALDKALALRMTWWEVQKMPFTQDSHDKRIAAELMRAYADGMGDAARVAIRATVDRDLILGNAERIRAAAAAVERGEG